MYKSDFQPIMKRYALALKIILLMAGVMFIVRSFVLPYSIEQIASLLLGILLMIIYIYLLMIIPSAIELDNEGITIKRVLGKKSIPYSVIKEVFAYNGVQEDVRYFGSNGFLGYIGIMGSTPYGKYYSYVKNPQQQVFVLISLLYPKEEKRKLTELLFTLQKLRLNDKMSASEKNTCMCSASDEC